MQSTEVFSLSLTKTQSVFLMQISYCCYFYYLFTSSSINYLFPPFGDLAFFIWDEPEQNFNGRIIMLYLLNPGDATICINTVVVKQESIGGKNQNGGS